MAVAVVVVLVLLGILLPPRLRPLPLVAAAGALVVGRAELQTAWHLHPTVLLTLGVSLVMCAVVAAVVRFEPDDGGGEAERDDDQGGGGGERRRPPAPPAPSSPCGQCPDWDAFDELRRGWERIPARTG